MRAAHRGERSFGVFRHVKPDRIAGSPTPFDSHIRSQVAVVVSANFVGADFSPRADSIRENPGH